MIEFFLANSLYGLITGLALLTYLTRFGGHLVLSSFKRIHPRVEAALQAVPAAVLAALVFPAVVTKGWLEAAAIALAVIACYRLPPIVVLLLSLAFLALGRQVLG